jgi:hypothetical protein
MRRYHDAQHAPRQHHMRRRQHRRHWVRQSVLHTAHTSVHKVQLHVGRDDCERRSQFQALPSSHHQQLQDHMLQEPSCHLRQVRLHCDSRLRQQGRRGQVYMQPSDPRRVPEYVLQDGTGTAASVPPHGRLLDAHRVPRWPGKCPLPDAVQGRLLRRPRDIRLLADQGPVGMAPHDIGMRVQASDAVRLIHMP